MYFQKTVSFFLFLTEVTNLSTQEQKFFGHVTKEAKNC